MKKTVIFRIVCAACLLLSMAMYIVAPWAKFTGIKKSDIKNAQKEVNNYCKELTDYLTQKEVLNELDDMGIEIDKATIKKTVTKYNKAANDLLTLEANPFTITKYTFLAIKLTKYFDEIVEDRYLVRVLDIPGSLVDDYDTVKTALYLSLIYTVILAIIGIFGLLGLVFSCMGKIGFTVTYFVLSTLFTILFVAAIVGINYLLHEESDMPSKYNLIPFYGAALSFIASLVALIFTAKDKKNKKAMAATATATAE